MENNMENTEEIQQNQPEVVENTNQESTEVQPVEQPEADWKTELDKAQKSYKELQSLYGRSSTELGELRKFKKEMEPYLGYLQQLHEQQKQQQYQQNPNLQIQEYLDSQLAPLREQQVEVQATRTVQTLQSELGETYDTLAPIMANVLRYYQEQEPQVAEYLASNPIALVRQAAGDLYLKQIIDSRSQKTQASQARQVAQKAMSGVAKGTVVGKSTPAEFENLNLDEMKAQLRKMGAALRPE